MIEPNYQESIDFLKEFRPKGFWVLTAVPLDRKSPTVTRSFAVSESVDALGFIKKQGENNNLYFSVNPTVKPMASKASRDDIASMDFLHVDLDPRPGEEFESERARIIASLTTGLPEDIPVPTYIIDSGGGYHAYWRLKEAFGIDGQSAKYEEAKRFNIQLEVTFDGDSCHNVDRIMRLPGTVNRPTAVKVKKGRSTYLSKVYYQSGNVYDLGEFTPAPLIQQTGELGFTGGTGLVKIHTDNVVRMGHIDDLGENVRDQCKMIIVQGDDPDDLQRFPSRSEAVFYVCCELVRSGVDDEVIYSIITDDQFGISESILEMGRRAESYAIRQIERARENAIHPQLLEMNERHAVIGDIDGKCRIISEAHDEGMDRSELTYQTAADFCIRYENRSVTMGEGEDAKEMPLGMWWRRHKQRRQYDRVVFSPGHDVPGCFNLWKGFSVEPRAGNCELFLEHVKKNICSSDEVLFKYLMGWMATAVQHPDKQGHVAVVLRGPKGAGKGKFATLFGKLFGRHFLQVVDAKHLVGSFNSHLRDCSILFADEAFYAGDKKHESVLKSIITEDTLMVEAKGVNAMSARNYLHVIMASNEDWVVPAGGDERRYLVLDVGSGNKQDHKFFAALTKEQNNGGQEALLHMLLHFDLSDFNVRQAPNTDALREQKEHSMSADIEWWFEKLQNGEVFDGDGWPKLVVKTHLAFDFLTHIKTNNKFFRSSTIKLGHLMKKVLPNSGTSKHTCQIGKRMSVIMETGDHKEIDRPRAFRMPSLEECRKHFDTKFGGPFDWTEPETVSPERGQVTNECF